MNKMCVWLLLRFAPLFQKVGNMLYQNNLNWSCVITYITMSTDTLKKQRGRKKKESVVQPVVEVALTVVDTDPTAVDVVPTAVEPIFSSLDEIKNMIIVDTNDTINDAPTQKRRGRRPKGGKIIEQPVHLNLTKESKPNVILHLKCSLKDLDGNGVMNQGIENFAFTANKNDLSYEIVSNPNHPNHPEPQSYSEDDNDSDNNKAEQELTGNDKKEIWRKLKQLEHNLHLNNIGDKKSACFWCTYEFDNPPVHIPKHHMNGSYHVYGCFCSPECATAHLMEEHIDGSVKFERYHLINHLYTKVYDYKKNIKPAPNPYYMLDKYYGNLTIQEYRALLKSERLFLVVDKPLTRILPELHEDNDDFIINNKIIPSNTYQVKKKVQRKQQTKSAILSENFGLHL